MGDITADIVRTMRHPVLVLDGDLRVTLVNPAFCETFQVGERETEGRPLHELGNGQWDIPDLRRLLGDLLWDSPEIRGYRVEHDFERIGRRTMLLNVKRMEGNGETTLLLAIEDITEREHERWELGAEKEFAEKIVDASRDPLLILDWDLRVKAANETFYETFRVEKEKTVGRLVYELGNGQWDIPRLRELLEDVLPENNAFDDFEVSHDFEGIGRREMVLNARRIDHKQWILLAIEDVTVSRRALRALRESERRLRLIVYGARDYAIFTADPDGLITGWYGGAESIFGWRTDEIVGRNATALFLPDEEAEAKEELRIAEREGTAPDVRWHLRKDGQSVFIDGRVMALRDEQGRLSGFLKMGQDVTERRRIEEQLRNSEERLRKVLDTEDVGVLFFNHSGIVTGANSAFLKMTGYSREEVETHTLHWRDLTPPEWVDISQQQIERLDKTGRLGPYEKEYFRRDGSRFWLRITGRDLGDGAIVEYCFDISDRKDLEKQRELVLAELNHRVKNTLAVVQGLAAQTLSRSRSLEEFGTAFQGRLSALARGHSQLLKGEWSAADLGRLVEQAVTAFGQDHVNVHGEAVSVSPRAALSLTMVLHELETNSSKYGALSNEEGRVDISWTKNDGNGVRMTWQETGGPPVSQPDREGFGTKLIKRLVEYDLDGKACIHFEPGGVRAEFTFPAVGPV